MSGEPVQHSAFADRQFGNILLQLAISLNAKRYHRLVIGEC
jgi:hypothetical protein